MDRDELAGILRLAPEQVRIVPTAVGGGFGGKLDLSCSRSPPSPHGGSTVRCAWSTRARKA